MTLSRYQSRILNLYDFHSWCSGKFTNLLINQQGVIFGAPVSTRLRDAKDPKKFSSHSFYDRSNNVLFYCKQVQVFTADSFRFSGLRVFSGLLRRKIIQITLLHIKTAMVSSALVDDINFFCPIA